MTIKPINAYAKWVNTIYAAHVPHNIISVQRMLKRWSVLDFKQIPVLLIKDPKLGPVTFNDRLSILIRFVKWCMKKKYIKENILEDVSRRKNNVVNKKRDPYSDEEIILLMNALYNDRFYRRYYYPFVKFMMLTGARNGEATGLRVKDVHLDKGYIHIQSSYSRDYEGKRKLKGPKTAQGDRYIPLNEDITDVLKPICERKRPGDFVFTNREGNPIDDNRFQKLVFKPLLKKLNIPVRDLYACRHTFGTIAVEQKMDILSVAYLMGHKKPRTVLDYYAKIRKKPTDLPKITLK